MRARGSGSAVARDRLALDEPLPHHEYRIRSPKESPPGTEEQLRRDHRRQGPLALVRPERNTSPPLLVLLGNYRDSDHFAPTTRNGPKLRNEAVAACHDRDDSTGETHNHAESSSPHTDHNSFPRSPWECRLRRSASSVAGGDESRPVPVETHHFYMGLVVACRRIRRPACASGVDAERRERRSHGAVGTSWCVRSGKLRRARRKAHERSENDETKPLRLRSIVTIPRVRTV
jgi:hypothetical protein